MATPAEAVVGDDGQPQDPYMGLLEVSPISTFLIDLVLGGEDARVHLLPDLLTAAFVCACETYEPEPIIRSYPYRLIVRGGDDSDQPLWLLALCCTLFLRTCRNWCVLQGRFQT